MVCMNGKVVLSRGLIHYLAGNHAKKMTWQAGGPRLRVLCLRHAQMEDDPCGDRSHTSEVIASRVATTDFAASSTKEGRLIQPFNTKVSIGSYWLTALKSKAETDAMRAFR